MGERIVLAVRPYAHGDAARIKAREDFALEHEAAGSPLFDAPPEGECWTLTRDGLPIGCAGASLEDGETWALWAFLADLGSREWAFARKATGEKIAQLAARDGRRFEATCRRDHAGGKRFLQALGFEEARQQRGWHKGHCGYRVMSRLIVEGV